MTVEDGSGVVLLLEAEGIEAGVAATSRVLEALDQDTTPIDTGSESDLPYLSAMSIYGGAHWGAYVDPPRSFADLAWIGALLRRTSMPSGPALILGAATGAEALQIPQPRAVVALDGSIPMLGFASGLTAGDAWMPRACQPGRYHRSRVILPESVRERLAQVQWVAADARQPPFASETFALVVAVNLLDSISHPAQMLRAAAAMLQPGGVLLLSTPYNWDDDVTHPSQRLDRSGILQILSEMTLEHEDSAVPWVFDVHDRLQVRYSLAAMLLRRRP